MRFRLRRAIGLACAVLSWGPAFADVLPPNPPPAAEGNKTKEVLTEAAIVAAIIAGSIAFYRANAKGPCACPEDTDRAGRRCGRRSAHDKPGGYVVQCYPSDVTKEMIENYRATH